LAKIFTLLLIISLGCAYSSALFAQSGVYQVAVRMAKAGEFDRALELFIALYRRGERDPKLLYNIAVCNYRLGNLTAAHDFYSQLLPNERYKALAAYNMGLIEAKTGDDVSAIRSFQLSLRSLSENDVALLNLNRKALRVLTKRNINYADSGKPWFASFGLSVAHDDNAQLLSNELLQSSAIQESDTVYSALLTTQITFAGTRNNGYKAGLLYNSLNYRKVDADSSIYSVFFDRVMTHASGNKGEWGLEIGRQTYLDYKDSTFAAKYKFTTEFSAKNRAEFSYRYLWIEPQYREQFWRGSLQEVKSKFSLGELTNNLSLTLRYEMNKRLDNNDPLQPISFSPNRAGFRLQYKYVINSHIYSMYYDFRASRYVGDTYDDSTMSLIQRKDRKKALNAAYRFTFKRHWQWSLNYYRQINSSNRSISSYQQTVIGTELTYIY